MARSNNFLLGLGEKLTGNVDVPTGGGPKNAPYSFERAVERVVKRLETANSIFSAFEKDATPNGEVVATITLHPRYVSKSDYPHDLLSARGLRTIGSRSSLVTPEQWGIKQHPEAAYTEQLFVAGNRKDFERWQKDMPSASASARWADELPQVEDLAAFVSTDKLKGFEDNFDRNGLLEIVLHNGGRQEIIEQFLDYLAKLGMKAEVHYRRDIRGLTFIPVRTNFSRAEQIARFTYVRVARPMPVLRTFQPTVLRSSVGPRRPLPKQDSVDPTVAAVIFDGGLSDVAQTALSRWVRYVEPQNIGSPVDEFTDHGLSVTSAFLFGSIEPTQGPTQPVCNVDHVRVLDNASGAQGEYMYLDALERIITHLENNPHYEFANFSLGPDLPASDNDVTEWTAALDQYLVAGKTLATVAVGNTGEKDPTHGNNRIQPPSDGVNVLSVGACTSQNATWTRALYSSIGPGRSPGYVKPDGLSFGGILTEPFISLGPNLELFQDGGTSLAAPNTLRSAAAIKAHLGTSLSPLAIRGLMIHRADDAGQPRAEVGWGRFEPDFQNLMTCDDDESLTVYQGSLPVGMHLRALVPMPDKALKGKVTLTATLLIAPEVDPDHPGAYTRSGLEVSFRPHEDTFTEYPDGTRSAHPKSKSFFSAKNLYGPIEAQARAAHYKWEPCVKYSQRMNASSLKSPCFDIYYHHRQSGQAATLPQPVNYALIISLKAPKVPDLYNQTVRSYANILVALRPQIQITVRR
jgi:hypothetical protein